MFDYVLNTLLHQNCIIKAGYIHGTITQTGVTGKKVPCYMRD